MRSADRRAQAARSVRYSEDQPRDDDGRFGSGSGTTAVAPEITKEQVDELRAKGFDSLRIAAALKTTLSEVNKHW